MKSGMFQYKAFGSVVGFVFLIQTLIIQPSLFAQINMLPAQPPMLMGLMVHPERPLEFQFIIDPGNLKDNSLELQQEGTKFAEYFLAGLAVPEDELWVNLSPHERNRIIPEKFGITRMGRDLLEQDYQLKQLSSEFLSPEHELGKQFWNELRAKFSEEFALEDLNIETFHRIWIVPDFATVFIHENNVFVAEHKFDVLLEQDYVDLDRQSLGLIEPEHKSALSREANELFKRIILPEIKRQVNESETFIPLRQAFYAMILATWYKANLKGSLVTQLYADKNKVEGIDLTDKKASEKIFNQYLKAFQTGVFDHFTEEYDPATQAIVMRKYVSGGVVGEVGRRTEVVNTSDRAMSAAGEWIRSSLLRRLAPGVVAFTVALFPSSASAQQGQNLAAMNSAFEPFLFDRQTMTQERVRSLFEGAGLEMPANLVFEAGMLDQIIPENGIGPDTDIRVPVLRFGIELDPAPEVVRESIVEIPPLSTESDRAVLAEEVGGIDLNPANWNLLTTGFQNNIIFQFDPKLVDQIKLDGLRPTVTHIQPLNNVPQLLGVQ